MKRIICIAAFAFIILSAGPLAALQIESVEVDTPVLCIVNTQGLNSAPSPVLWAPGAALNIPLGNRFYWRPALNLYSTYYLWDDATGRALPAEEENRYVWVFGFVLDSGFVYDIPIGRDWGISVGAGPAFDIRICVQPIVADGSDSSQEVANAWGYFYKDFRFVYPEVSFMARYRLFDRVSAGLGGRVFFPVYHLWDGASLPFQDELMFSAGLFLRFGLGK